MLHYFLLAHLNANYKAKLSSSTFRLRI